MQGIYKFCGESSPFDGIDMMEIYDFRGDYYIKFYAGHHIIREMQLRDYLAGFVARPGQSFIRFFKTYAADVAIKCAIAIAFRRQKITIKTFYDYKFRGAFDRVWFAAKKETFTFAKS